MTHDRQQLIAGNWKMHHGGPGGCELASAIVRACGDLAGVDVVVAPPFTALAAVAHEVEGSRVTVASQNLHPEPKGAFTGEISPQMLVDCGCTWAIIGHSERRHIFGETDDFVQKKVKAAIAARLRPIVCVGETLEQREAGKTLEVVSTQVGAVLTELSQTPGFGVIAYEPVWAIGTGKVAGPEQAQEVHAAIRAQLSESSTELGSVTRILYGGSVKPDNAGGLLSCPDIDGALVGGASLDAASFVKIVEAAPSPV